MSDKQQKPICPFKKIVELEYSGQNGASTFFTVRERFDVCAEERCVAYVPGTTCRATCKRLEPNW